jgi:hypothetical protein
MPQVVSANRLADGIVVFWNRGGWVELLDQAEVLDSKPDIESATLKAQADVAANRVVDIFAFDVKAAGGHIEAVTLRDRIRTAGPTVHRDHGKQAVAR